VLLFEAHNKAVYLRPFCVTGLTWKTGLLATFLRRQEHEAGFLPISCS